MKSKSLARLSCIVFAALASGPVYAIDPVSASQLFKVIVPESLSITAPSAQELTHDQTDNPQAFAPQTWTVKNNTINGVNVTFATTTAFQHSTDPTFKRNAKLDLALGTVQGPAAWQVLVPSDTTNYVTNDGVAQVEATSNGVGRASFNLTVTFVTEEYGLFAAGDYVTTVTGTVAAK